MTDGGDMPTVIPDLPAWLVAFGGVAWSAIVAAVAWVAGGRRKADAEASKVEADTAQILTKAAGEMVKDLRAELAEVRRIAGDASGRSKRLEIEAEQTWRPLAAFVLEWDQDCRHCETRPAMPPELLERVKKFKGGSEPH